ncbi:hypothetical protein HDU84_006993 [Entophlyctis sp. JEL0112]|nr:hypothetical protein HDU84_006993 [Entophlyctis sp. JEL0112]
MDQWFGNIASSLAHAVSEASAQLDHALEHQPHEPPLPPAPQPHSLPPAPVRPDSPGFFSSVASLDVGSLVQKGLQDAPSIDILNNLNLPAPNDFFASYLAPVSSSSSASPALANTPAAAPASPAPPQKRPAPRPERKSTTDSPHRIPDEPRAVVSPVPPPTTLDPVGSSKSPSLLDLGSTILSPDPIADANSQRESLSNHHPKVTAPSPNSLPPAREPSVDGATSKIVKDAVDTPISTATLRAAEEPELHASPEDKTVISDAVSAGVDSGSLSPDNQHFATLLAQREKQLLAASAANIALADDIENLRAQIAALEAAADSRRDTIAGGELLTDTAALQEFSRRLETAEKAGSAALKDRDKYKASLNSLQISFDDTIRKLAEREEKIKALLEEGEKLSKNELKMSNIVKKLRAKETETDTQLKDQAKKIEALSIEVSELKEKLFRVTESERKLGDSLKNNTEITEKQAKLISKLEGELSTAKAEQSSLKNQLERARADLQEAKRLQADVTSAAHAEALEAEISANEALHKQLLDQQKQFTTIESALQKEVFDLRSALSRVEDEANWKEARLQASDSRHEDLFAEARNADRPLVRQIESLQLQHAAARKDWEQIEISLTTRLHEAERESLEHAEREKTSVQRFEELTKRFQTLEYQFQRERQERSRVQAELDENLTKLDDADRSVSDLTAKIALMKTSHAKAMEEARELFQAVDDERRRGEEQLKEERDRQAARERVKVDDMKHLADKAAAVAVAAGSPAMPSGPGAPLPSPSLGFVTMRQNSVSSDGFGGASAAHEPSGRGSFLDAGGSGFPGHNMVVEKLYHNLKQLQGQVTSLQTQLQMVTKTRDELAEELVKVSEETSSTQTMVTQIESLEAQLRELNARYMAALELLGEKTELVEDLQQNIAELRKIQRGELEQLLNLTTGSNA